MPSAAENLATVQAMYSAFGQGNLDGVLPHLADDIEWMKKPDKPNLGQEAGVSELSYHHGIDGVRDYFKQWGEKTELSKFKVGKMVASDNTVVVWIDQTFTVKATGKVVDDYIIHEFVFNDDGKVNMHFAWCDTAKHIEGEKSS